jgi:hypothetical protein
MANTPVTADPILVSVVIPTDPNNMAGQNPQQGNPSDASTYGFGTR